jgi:hypothetical protein
LIPAAGVSAFQPHHIPETSMTDLERDWATLLARLPALPDDAELDAEDTEIGCSIDRQYNSSLFFSLTKDAYLQVTFYSPGVAFEEEGNADDPELLAKLHEGLTRICALPEADQWEPGEYGYTDSNFVGTEKWEDQAQMASLKATLKIDPSWYLMKVIRFDVKKLQEIEVWLADTCMGQHKRVGWSSGCSTTVGIAFEYQHDAIMYTLRWK